MVAAPRQRAAHHLEEAQLFYPVLAVRLKLFGGDEASHWQMLWPW